MQSRKQFLKALLIVPFAGKIVEAFAKNKPVENNVKKWYWESLPNKTFAQWDAGKTCIKHVEGDGFYCNNPEIEGVSWWGHKPHISGYGEIKDQLEISIKAYAKMKSGGTLFRESRLIKYPASGEEIKSAIALCCNTMAFYIDQKHPIKSGGDKMVRVYSNFNFL